MEKYVKMYILLILRATGRQTAGELQANGRQIAGKLQALRAWLPAKSRMHMILQNYAKYANNCRIMQNFAQSCKIRKPVHNACRLPTICLRNACHLPAICLPVARKIKKVYIFYIFLHFLRIFAENNLFLQKIANSAQNGRQIAGKSQANRRQTAGIVHGFAYFA